MASITKLIAMTIAPEPNKIDALASCIALLEAMMQTNP